MVVGTNNNLTGMFQMDQLSVNGKLHEIYKLSGKEEVCIMEYLYHGSSGYFKTLKPHQAYDIGFEEGRKNAVYATSNKNMALSFALGAIPDQNGELERIMMPEFGDKMIFEKGTPNYGGKGYLYLLDEQKFQHSMGTQWVCFEEVEPVEIQEINVDDYLYLCQVRHDTME